MSFLPRGGLPPKKSLDITNSLVIICFYVRDLYIKINLHNL